jgi:Glycosyl transferases group 1
MAPNNRDVVAFIHTYAADGSFDPFMSSLIEAFEAQGARLHVIRTNDLVDHLGATSLSRRVSEGTLIRHIKSIRPAFILSTNRGGITGRMTEELDCPIISWLVDHVPFKHDGGDSRTLFGPRDHVVVSASAMVPAIEKRYPALAGRTHFLPFATREGDRREPGNSAPDINVSFVGTFFYGHDFLVLLRRYRNDARISSALLAAASAVERDFRSDIEGIVDKLGLSEVLADNHVAIEDLHMAIANVASMNKRIRALDAIADLGLVLWGTDNWIDAAAYSLPLLRCYRFGEFIKTREQLSEVYRRSRVAVDVPHVQAVGGLPYRVFDILASPALLITEYHPESDLFRLFGKNAPVPTYRNTDDLRRIVQHYLANEDERRAVVEKCNALVANGFHFTDRVRELFQIAGAQPPDDQCGEIVHVAPSAVSSKLVWLTRSANDIRPANDILDLLQAILLIIPLSGAYLLLTSLSASKIKTIARLTRKVVPSGVYRWLIRELVFAETAKRVIKLQERLRIRTKEIVESVSQTKR